MSLTRDLGALGGIPVFVLVLFLLSDRALALVAAFVLMMAVAVPVRLLTQRRRPNGREGATLIARIRASSMPSVHTARAGIIAAAISTSVWMLVPAVALITVVAAARIVSREHDLLDVVTGAALGVASWALTLSAL